MVRFRSGVDFCIGANMVRFRVKFTSCMGSTEVRFRAGFRGGILLNCPPQETETYLLKHNNCKHEGNNNNYIQCLGFGSPKSLFIEASWVNCV